MTLRAALAAAVLLLGAATARAGWWDDTGTARRTTLEDVRRDPDRWRDVAVLLEVAFVSLSDARPPDASQFSTGTWRGVAVRSSGAESSAAFAGVFVEDGSAGERRLREVPAGKRVQLRAAVREIVGGDPRLEVFDVVADGDPLTPEETALAARGEHLLAQDNPAAAEQVLRELAGRRTLPREVQVRIWRRIGEACWSQRHLADAVAAYTAALAADPADTTSAAKLEAARAALASAPRTVTGRGETPEEPPLPPVPLIPRKLLPPSGLTATAAPETPAEAPALPPPGAPETPQEKLVEKPGQPARDDPPPPPPRPPLAPPR